jgi:hypothetical protein
MRIAVTGALGSGANSDMTTRRCGFQKACAPQPVAREIADREPGFHLAYAA